MMGQRNPPLFHKECVSLHHIISNYFHARIIKYHHCISMYFRTINWSKAPIVGVGQWCSKSLPSQGAKSLLANSAACTGRSFCSKKKLGPSYSSCMMLHRYIYIDKLVPQSSPIGAKNAGSGCLHSNGGS